MKGFLFTTLLFLSAGCLAQSTGIDSCLVIPLYTASFEGIVEKGMLSVEKAAMFKRMLPEDNSTIILRFTYSIDCDKCDLFMKEVYADTLSADDQARISKVSGGNIISFECITGKDKKGTLVSYKPFLFYIKP